MPAWHYTAGLYRGRLSLAVLALTEALMPVGKSTWLSAQGNYTPYTSVLTCCQNRQSRHFPQTTLLMKTVKVLSTLLILLDLSCHLTWVAC